MCSLFANKYLRLMRKIFSESPSKDIETFFIKVLCHHLTSTVDKSYHGPVLTPFSKCYLVTNLFYCYS